MSEKELKASRELTASERRRLVELEAVVDVGLQSFRDVADALAEMNDIAIWLPLLRKSSVWNRVPETTIVQAPGDLACLLDGEDPPGLVDFLGVLSKAALEMGTPCFLRTGHTSGKHGWNRNCYLPTSEPDVVAQHVFNLVEYSHLVDLMGLPTDTWAVRRLIHTEPLFFMGAWDDFPVTREFRFFIRDGRVEHVQPYWPPDALEDAEPNLADWRERLARASELTDVEYRELKQVAVAAEAAVGGYWSVDLLQDRRGKWWITDMARGEATFRWSPDA